MVKFIAVVLFCFSNNLTLNAQTDSIRFFDRATEYNPKRAWLTGTSLGVVYGASMTGLYSLWYKDYPMGNFHLFDDNAEWLQVDKVGHLASAYYLGNWGIGLFRWTGMDRKKSILIGGASGWVFLTTIEIFDGFSDQWGFSTGDMIANTAGSAISIGQELLWDEQRIKLKFSFHQSDYAQYRPDQLGDSFTENLFKDYNGQTYWLSLNLHSFLNHDSGFPKWLNVAFGYGAEGMTGARSNVVSVKAGDTTVFPRYRQYYISPDIDLTRIPTKSRTLKTIFSTFGFLKVPAPALEITDHGKIKMNWLYF